MKVHTLWPLDLPVRGNWVTHFRTLILLGVYGDITSVTYFWFNQSESFISIDQRIILVILYELSGVRRNTTGASVILSFDPFI